jgi:hypothetical protein
MNRIIAILLLVLLLYNAFGYHLLFAYKREQARALSWQNLPESAYHIIKLNLAIYTSLEDTEFEFVHKEWTIGENTYHVIKKRIQRDSLLLYYLPNYEQTELRKQWNDIIESQIWNDNTADNTPLKQLLKCFLKEYTPNEVAALLLQAPSILLRKAITPTSTKAFKPSNFSALFSPPPETSTRFVSYYATKFEATSFG